MSRISFSVSFTRWCLYLFTYNYILLKHLTPLTANQPTRLSHYCKIFHYNVYFHCTMKSIDIAKGKELEDRLVYELPGLFSDLDFTVGSVRRETRLDGSDDPQQRIDILADVKLPNNKVQLAIEVKNTERLTNVREAAYQIKRYTEGSSA